MLATAKLSIHSVNYFAESIWPDVKLARVSDTSPEKVRTHRMSGLQLNVQRRKTEYILNNASHPKKPDMCDKM